jgi:hypothetical protein
MSNQDNSKNTSSFFKEWLEKLQQESWQLELLISGFALFGIWEAKPFIEEIANTVDINQSSGLVKIVAVASISTVRAGWIIFFINLLIHIILRGLWIGAIGLRYVSNEIDYEALNYSDWMTKYLKKSVGNYDDYIERLEKLCSVIFAYTFLLFFIFLSAAIFFTEIAMISQVFNPKNTPDGNLFILAQTAILVFLTLGIIVFIDFITIGAFKKVKDPTFAKVYGWIYRFYSYATFSFLYRALLYNFLDEPYTKRLFLLSIPYVLAIVFIIPTFYSNAHPHFPKFKETKSYQNEVMYESYVSNYFYDDLRETSIKTGYIKHRKPINTMSLASYEVSGNFMRTFINMKQSDKDYLDQQGVASFFEDGIRSTIQTNVKSDLVLERLDSLRNEDKSPLLAERRAMRKQLREEGLSARQARLKINPIFEGRLDSIDYIYDSLRQIEIRQRFSDVRSAILDLSEIRIDGKLVPPNIARARFYIHPNAGEKGLLYHIPIDSLALGPHILSVNRCTEIEKDGSRSYFKLTIPFVKVD